MAAMIIWCSKRKMGASLSVQLVLHRQPEGKRGVGHNVSFDPLKGPNVQDEAASSGISAVLHYDSLHRSHCL